MTPSQQATRRRLLEALHHAERERTAMMAAEVVEVWD